MLFAGRHVFQDDRFDRHSKVEMRDTRLQLIDLLKDVLGEYKEYPKQNEAAFYCPACNHHKKKLQINTATGYWHCWVCQVDNNMSGKSFFSLFKKVGASVDQIARLSDIIGRYKVHDEKLSSEQRVNLPTEFVSLLERSASPHYKNAMFYLRKRGLIPEDIARYNIGYAEDGEYKSKIIIPSYNERAQLNFFIGRAFYKDDTYKHKIPPISKNIIGFELLINWNYPIILVEGAFDAISTRRNAIPMFGKSISDKLRLKIIETGVKDIYIALDRDALRETVKYAEMFMGEGRNVYLVDLVGDPSQIGFEGMMHLIRDTKKASFSDMMKFRLR